MSSSTAPTQGAAQPDLTDEELIARRIFVIACKHANAFMQEIDVRGNDAQWLRTRDRLAAGLASIVPHANPTTEPERKP